MNAAIKIAAALVIAVVSALIVFGRSKSPEEQAYAMAQYMLREYIRRDLGFDPNAFTISDWRDAVVLNARRLTWVVEAEYAGPLGDPLPWSMRLYGPFDGQKWRNCELTIAGETATRVGEGVPCGER